jgi:hypothetical protein
MRKPLEKTFKKDVEGIGTFIFQYLTLREELQVENLVAKLLEYNKDPEDAPNIIARMIATLSVVVVQAPDHWDVNEIYDFKELEKVFEGYTNEVQFFRGNGDREVKEQGTPISEKPEILVPPAVPTARKRP